MYSYFCAPGVPAATHFDPLRQRTISFVRIGGSGLRMIGDGFAFRVRFRARLAGGGFGRAGFRLREGVRRVDLRGFRRGLLNAP